MECVTFFWMFFVVLIINKSYQSSRNQTENEKICAVGGRQRICVPMNYQKYDLPDMKNPTLVTIGVDIKDIPKVSDKDFSITINAYFNVKWRDPRLLVSKDYSKEGEPDPDSEEDFDAPTLTAINLNILHQLWLPDVEILNLKSFETHSVLSKLEGIWIDSNLEVMYALATRITFICPMRFNAFPMDIQVCKFQVGSFNYDMSKMAFQNEFVPKDTSIKSILDYQIAFSALKDRDTHYMAIGMNYSATGFELVLTRKMSFYVVTYYLPSGLFVIVSWISFLVNPEIIPGQMIN
ncbi:glycine receptor subunit alpha-3 [Eurytemora carolleeae]|uniref:glycine receptor subunit alpha-3 n=1 Tax=Eurytemora carolleeae TaxID=1294199 RepID=UPI000C76F828|nr:glycine receptor subunit alpha-3 [Eurytemora carolleeae]|eukprot:XP_023335266.1 glycine receptor subunit alpha-3-like [Eurytemora affinis]